MNVQARARQAIRAGGFLGATATMLPLYLAHAKRAPNQADHVRDAWVRRWARCVLDLFAIEVIVDGAIPSPVQRGSRGRLIVSNHRSAIDIGVLLANFGGTLVSRADLSSWPVLGQAARAVGTVFVERDSTQSRVLTIRAIQRKLEAGSTIAVFPEGTTYEGDEVRAFFSGAFVAAIAAGADVLPVGLAYPRDSGAAYVNESFGSHLRRMAQNPGTRMGLAVGKPIHAERMRSSRLTNEAHAEVSRLVARARLLSGP